MEKLIFLKPFFSHTVWGGNRIRTDFGYDEPGDDIGECWGISAHPAGDCIIRNGEYEGKTLSWLYDNHREFFGNCPEQTFPLLVKIIDARENLSVQVHPDDAYAFENENGARGKTECWYIIDCEENAELIIGHNAGTRQELKEMTENGRWDELIRKVPVKRGDFIQIDSGTVHAVTAGCMILETQQSSNITYRLYDYDRKPARSLHIAQSIDTITVPAKDISESVFYADEKDDFIYRNNFYEVEVVRVDGIREIPGAEYFQNISVIAGHGKINGEKVKKGDHIIASAGTGIQLEGSMKLVRSTCSE